MSNLAPTHLIGALAASSSPPDAQPNMHPSVRLMIGAAQEGADAFDVHRLLTSSALVAGGDEDNTSSVFTVQDPAMPGFMTRCFRPRRKGNGEFLQNADGRQTHTLLLRGPRGPGDRMRFKS